MIKIEELKRVLDIYLSPLHIEYQEDGIRVTASTGMINYSMWVSIEALVRAADLEKFTHMIKRKLDHEIEKIIFSNRYKDTEFNPVLKEHIMVDIMCPKDYHIIVVHPERYASLLKCPEPAYVRGELRSIKAEEVMSDMRDNLESMKKAVKRFKKWVL